MNAIIVSNWSSKGGTVSEPAPRPEAHNRFLHVTEPGAMLRRSGHRIRVCRQKQVLGEVSSLRLQGVLLYGNVHVSTPCLRHLMEEGVWLAFFSSQGIYKGRIASPAGGCGGHRMRQWAALANPGLRLDCAREFVRGKLRGALGMAKQMAKSEPGLPLTAAYSQLGSSLAAVETVCDLETLRGLEGTAARAWFDLFRGHNRSGLEFPSRQQHGTHNPVNALLNFGYALLLREWDGLLAGAGLDPIAGLYHETDGSRPSLACDMMEEYRHALVDRLVLRLLNRGEVGADSFEDSDAGVRLTQPALRKFVTAWEESLLGRTGDPLDPPGYRAVFLRQITRLLDALRGKSPYRCHLEA